MASNILLTPKEMKDVLANPVGHDIEWPQAANKKLAMSFSKFADFETCPRQYAERHLWGTVKSNPNAPQLVWGNYVHKQMENHILKGMPLAKDVKQFQSVANAIIEKENNLHERGKLRIPIFGEQEWAMGLDGRKKEWFDSSGVFVRGKADVGMGGQRSLFVYDYKTGAGKYPKPEQIELMGLLATARNSIRSEGQDYPAGGFDFVVGALLFLEARKQVPVKVPVASMTENLAKWQKKAFAILDCYQRDDFPARENGLCRKFCPVASCPFNGRTAQEIADAEGN